MNLLFDPWIPLRRRSGAVETVLPWQITDRHEEDPFTGFASVRPDFDGALAQFLIGLLQTALAPERGREWRQRFDSPPSPEFLREAFQPLAFAFELFGDGPRFLQDLTLEADDPDEERIERLLIPNTLSEGNDHFVKIGQIEALCPSCSAMALLTLQLNAPQGGRGNLTGLRGGGPLTTLVVYPESLWKTLWLNVLPLLDLDGEKEKRKRHEDCFPWLAPTRTNKKNTELTTTLADVHPLQMYWGMPRRIRLYSGLLPDSGELTCSLCGASRQPLVLTYFKRPYGVNYTGAWNHPLTPYRQTEGGFLPRHGSSSGLSYRHWLGLVQNDSKRQARPAEVVKAFRENPDRRGRAEHVLWAFGYAIDKAKALAWLDSRMPLFIMGSEIRGAFELDTERLVLSADEAAYALISAIKRTLPDNMLRAPADVGVRFWQETEAPFYKHLRNIRDHLEKKEETIAPRRDWLNLLWKTANRTFETVTVVGSFEATDPKKVALAWNGLQRFFMGPKLRELLGLPVPPKKTGKKTAARPAETGDAP
jgi:CRISPR system Cascade subunit CasA